MNAHRTIPINLEDWLHSFGAALERHAFAQRVDSRSNIPQGTPLGLNVVNRGTVGASPTVITKFKQERRRQRQRDTGRRPAPRAGSLSTTVNSRSSSAHRTPKTPNRLDRFLTPAVVAALLYSASLWAHSAPLSLARGLEVTPAGDRPPRPREFEDNGAKPGIHEPQIDKRTGTDSETRSGVAVTALRGADPPSGEARVVIGRPSIFWHNGQWQTYNDGIWTPYGKPISNRLTQPRNEEDAGYSGPGIGDLDRGAALRKSETRRRGSDAGGVGTTTIGVGQPNAIEQSTRGLGEPDVGIGQSTIGIGQPNEGIGQPNGIGQTAIETGEPNVGIGPNNIGIGQPTIGIGQPTIGIGQPTIGIGQPTIGIGQPTIGIGQPTIGIGQPNTRDQTTPGIGQPATFPNQQRQ